MKIKKLSDTDKSTLTEKIKALLHASRDCMRNQRVDTTTISFSAHDPYYCEAFGMLRTLEVFGYGKLSPRGKGDFNLVYWLNDLCDEVLKEENYDSTNECSYCLEHYGKDGAGRTRRY